MQHNSINPSKNTRKRLGDDINGMLDTDIDATFDKRAKSINKGMVSKGAFPSFVGMTPEVDLYAMNSTAASMTQKNKRANERA